MIEAFNTVQSIFDIAIRQMDSQNESTGSTNTADTKEYALRTPSLLNSILDRCLPASDIQPKPDPGRRPVVPKVSKMDDVVQLDERICTGVLPFGLAALLLLEEDPDRANFMWQTFLEQLEECRRTKPAEEVEIEDVYGGIGLGQFGDW